MRKLLFLGALAFISCKEIGGRVPTKEELLEKEMKSIDWKQVDEYPSIAACDSLPDAEQREHCFFEFMASAVQERLNSDTLPSGYADADTLRVKVTVFPDAHVEFRTTEEKAPSYDSILSARLADFPKISPALKRGLPVKTEFILPVVLKAN